MRAVSPSHFRLHLLQQSNKVLFMTPLPLRLTTTHHSQYFTTSDCLSYSADPSPWPNTTFVNGSAFNGIFALDECYGVIRTNGTDAVTTYYLDTFDPDLNTVTWRAFSDSACTVDAMAPYALQSQHGNGIEYCGKCVNEMINGTRTKTSRRATGCPAPKVKKPPTSVKQGTWAYLVSVVTART